MAPPARPVVPFAPLPPAPEAGVVVEPEAAPPPAAALPPPLGLEAPVPDAPLTAAPPPVAAPGSDRAPPLPTDPVHAGASAALATQAPRSSRCDKERGVIRKVFLGPRDMGFQRWQ
jgi:hypothetical protein